ncbi:MAG: PLP-dependent aspartate aminotransferase family protein [bacterium]
MVREGGRALKSSNRFETRAIQKGNQPDPGTGAVNAPIYQTSTYVQQQPGEHSGYEYSRMDNPTRSRLEENLASLEGAEHAFSFASGMAAIDTVLNLLESGDHVVAGKELYGGTTRLFDELYRKYELTFDYVDPRTVENITNHLRDETRLVWLESPTNPTLSLVDIESVREEVPGDVLVGVDNTFATPYLQNPLELGADLAVHSTTKYLGGHSDLLGGAICVNDDGLAERLQFYRNTTGAVPGPMDCFLTLRGIKTLAPRMDVHCRNARRVAQFLQTRKMVERVLYPGLESHPQHDLADRQMNKSGGMVSAELAVDKETTARAIANLEIFHLAGSLGGVESLVEQPATMSHSSLSKQQRLEAGLPDGLIRLSVGIEHPDDLTDDLRRMLRQLN